MDLFTGAFNLLGSLVFQALYPYNDWQTYVSLLFFGSIGFSVLSFSISFLSGIFRRSGR